MNVIETHALTKYYGKSRGIIDLNLSVEEGDIFGFMGPNGAGKSTTIRQLLGLITPTSGSASVFGLDCVKDKTEILKNVGYMPSEAMFYPSMRVEDVIKLSARLHKKDCSKEARDLCERLQMDTRKRINELSLGNRRKVSIVCAVQHDPRLYIMDEPTSGLDPLMQKEFFSILKEKNKKGATIFLSSHVLSEIQRYCKNAGIVQEGKLIARDSVEELSKSSVKRIVIHGNEKMPEIEGVMNVKQYDDHVSFLFGGNINELISVLSQMKLTDITISEPDLEEIFLHFYKR